jgi:hypothetical protein
MIFGVYTFNAVMFAIYGGRYQYDYDERSDWFWFIPVISTIMLSISPLIGNWLNGLAQQGKKVFFKNSLSILAIWVTNSIFLALIMVFSYDSLPYFFGRRHNPDGYFMMATVSLFQSLMLSLILCGALALASWFTKTRARVLAGSGARAGFAAYPLFISLAVGMGRRGGGMETAIILTAIWAWLGAWASEELLQSVGKWKAMLMLLGTGFAGLFVGLLVKVLFVR